MNYRTKTWDNANDLGKKNLAVCYATIILVHDLVHYWQNIIVTRKIYTCCSNIVIFIKVQKFSDMDLRYNL